MLTTVIIPTFNRATLIERALKSVLNQTHKQLQIIVVDDGSTDNTQKVLAPYHGRIQYIYQENKGVSAARNKGIEKAHGNIITFLDSDDEWLPQKIDAQVNFFKENPEAVACQTGETWIRKGKRVNPKDKHKKHSGFIYKQCLPLCIVTISAIALKKEILERVGAFDESMPACEDYDLWLRTTHRYPIHLIDRPLVTKYGGRPDQLSQSTPQMDQYRIQSMIQLLDSQVLTEEQRKWTTETLREKCTVFGNGCIKHGKNEKGQYYLDLIQKYETT